MNKFVVLNKYGDLLVDKILFEASYPILFTCIDENKNVFICVCCQNNVNGKKWLISKCEPSTLVKMLKDEIPLRDAFLENNECRVTVNSFGDCLEITYNDENDWGKDSICLPKAGEYIEADIGEFQDEIEYYTNYNLVSYEKEYYKNIIEATNLLQENIATIIDDLYYALENCLKVITSEVIQTLKVIEKISYSDVETNFVEYKSNDMFCKSSVLDLRKEKLDLGYELMQEEQSDFLEAA